MFDLGRRCKCSGKLEKRPEWREGQGELAISHVFMVPRTGSTVPSPIPRPCTGVAGVCVSLQGIGVLGISGGAQVLVLQAAAGGRGGVGVHAHVIVADQENEALVASPPPSHHPQGWTGGRAGLGTADYLLVSCSKKATATAPPVPSIFTFLFGSWVRTTGRVCRWPHNCWWPAPRGNGSSMGMARPRPATLGSRAGLSLAGPLRGWINGGVADASVCRRRQETGHRS